MISNEQLYTNSALGWHYKTPQGHMIVPAVLRKPSKGWGAFNPNTIASAFYNATHEFGHALISSEFYRGIAPDLQIQMGLEAQEGVITSTGLPEAQAAVVAEYNAMKGRVIDGSMTAEQFVNE